jgi:hypothetical protein
MVGPPAGQSSKDRGQDVQDYEVIERLRVAFVDVVGEEVVVDLYGGAEPLCGTIRYRFTDRAERRAHRDALARWAHEGTVLTYVRRGSQVSLVDDAAVLRRGLGQLA